LIPLSTEEGDVVLHSLKWFRPNATPIGTLDKQTIAAMRLTLTVSALLIIYINPHEPDRFVALTYAVLTLYTLYSTVLYGLARLKSRLIASISHWTHWADVGWYTLLIALSSGTNSVFFFGFFFAILVASFRWGYASGLSVTLASTILFTVVGYLTAPAQPEFDLNRFLLRPVYLLVLGYMMAYWGGFETKLKRQLALLKEVSAISNPRFGVDRTIGGLMEQVRAYYDADSCMMLTREAGSEEYILRVANRNDPDGGSHPQHVPTAFAQELVNLPQQNVQVYGGAGRTGRGTPTPSLDQAQDDHATACERIASLLDAVSFIAVPVSYRSRNMGWLYLTSDQRNMFDTSDGEFLVQVIEHVTPVIENIRLVDQLASDAADVERRKIARDLHDSIIQPYIGLKMGLAAIRSTLDSRCSHLAPDLDRLLALADAGIGELRGYVHGLTDVNSRRDDLCSGIERFGAKFAEATRIDVKVQVDGEVQVNDRLAAEVFQIVAEGLSNVRKHTTAECVRVLLRQEKDRLCISIENDIDHRVERKPFTPRSITERAAALGGHAAVEDNADVTRVHIEIPL
jgi:signal transduction histidine kinase